MGAQRRPPPPTSPLTDFPLAVEEEDPAAARVHDAHTRDTPRGCRLWL